MVFYLCDGLKCKKCSDGCVHTSDYKHAAYKTIIPKDLSLTFNYDQCGNLWEKKPEPKTLNRLEE